MDYKESKKHLRKFLRKLNNEYKEFKYIWVLEYGTLNGRLHYHLLTNITLPKNINFNSKRKSQKRKQFENDFSAKFWGLGFIDIRDLQQENNNNIALYVSCYITKDLIDKELNGFRIYGYSKTLNKPLVYKDYTDRDIKDIIKDFSSDFNITYSNSYEIGYTKDGKKRAGVMSYIDMTRKDS